MPPELKKLRLITQKVKQHSTLVAVQDLSVQVSKEVTQYVAELSVSAPSNAAKDDALSYWKERKMMYTNLALFAEDLVSAPASQAFVERIFSLCGMLCAGRRNRTNKNLEMKVFLKLNWGLISSLPSY